MGNLFGLTQMLCVGYIFNRSENISRDMEMVWDSYHIQYMYIELLTYYFIIPIWLIII